MYLRHMIIFSEYFFLHKSAKEHGKRQQSEGCTGKHLHCEDRGVFKSEAYRD